MTFLRRALRASFLDKSVYEEVEADVSANTQALVLVLASAVAAGIGAAGGSQRSMGVVVVYIAIALLAWSAWALLIYQIGAKLFPATATKTDLGELLRTLGFAAAPGMLRFFGVIPSLSQPLFALTAVWMLLAMVVAVRQALDYTSTLRAVGVCFVGWFVMVAIIVLLSALVTPPLA